VTTVDVMRFTEALGRMSDVEVRRVAAGLADGRSCVADDLTWWEATVDIERALKVQHRRREAAMAAHHASAAVQTAASHAGMSLPDDEVTRVARAAADVARGLAAGPLADDAVRHLLVHWAPLFTGAH
jgi:hypothetical protein